ncbi:UNVERIFIED_ORG: putative phage infection (PIP) family protein YhgE [Leuconostoc holzapfelii]
MLIFCLCLAAMFLFWLFGHVLGFCLYIVILFVGHLISYWYLYGPLLIVTILGTWFGITNLIVLALLTILILVLCLALILVKRH